jgi:hypothetical protein
MGILIIPGSDNYAGWYMIWVEQTLWIKIQRLRHCMDLIDVLNLAKIVDPESRVLRIEKLEWKHWRSRSNGTDLLRIVI